jgi:hypothetical protein
MDWARGQVNERWQTQVNVVRTHRDVAPGIDATRILASMPMTFLRPPTSWTPSTSDILVVTRIWRDVVWVWNESQDHSHRGVGLLTAQWLLGDVPHFLPARDKHIHICQLLPDASDVPVVQMSSMPPRGWPGGRGIWLVQWLEGM